MSDRISSLGLKSWRAKNKSIRYSTETTMVIWNSTQPISNYYGNTEKVITFLMKQCFWPQYRHKYRIK